MTHQKIPQNALAREYADVDLWRSARFKERTHILVRVLCTPPSFVMIYLFYARRHLAVVAFVVAFGCDPIIVELRIDFFDDLECHAGAITCVDNRLMMGVGDPASGVPPPSRRSEPPKPTHDRIRVLSRRPPLRDSRYRTRKPRGVDRK